jgi:hypothetical protein
MSYRGHIKGGVVILDEPAGLPEGAEVQVHPVEPAKAATVWEKLLALAGQADGLPKDAAENLDHYFYGTPDLTRSGR